MSTPAEDGFLLAAEWMQHRRCWMAWPCQSENWPHQCLLKARHAYAHVARHIARFEPVTILCHPDETIDASLVGKVNIHILSWTLTDSWMRDIGPGFLVNQHGAVAGVCWQFNAWGEQETAESSIGRQILTYLDMPCYTAPLVLEGGAIHVDGQGTLLTTEECLLHPNRNHGLQRGEIEAMVCAYTGSTQIIWLGQGYQDDDTNGHIDAVACFVRPGVVVALDTDDPQDGNYKSFKDNLARLRGARDATGRSLEVITVKQPYATYQENRRLPLSYINYYVANNAIILPSFRDVADREAFELFQRLYPQRTIIEVPARDIAPGGGGIHCITLAEPRG